MHAARKFSRNTVRVVDFLKHSESCGSSARGNRGVRKNLHGASRSKRRCAPNGEKMARTAIPAVPSESPTADFTLENHGSLFLLRPLTDLAREWMNEHLPVDHSETRFFGDAIVVESDFVGQIVQGIVGDGLVLR
jgi:hypothetical protein